MPRINHNNEEAIRASFGLRNEQMRSDTQGLPFAKNQWWYLDEDYLGYGDLSQDDILRIAEKLMDGETFVTFNEHDGHEAHQAYVSPFEFGLRPRLIISNKDIQFPQHEEQKRRAEERKAS